MPEGYATWKSLWREYYKLNDIFPGSTTDIRDATLINEKRFDRLKINRLIPQDSVFVEAKSKIKGA